MADVQPVTLPWLAAPLQRALETREAHALLVSGPGDVGQFELAQALAQAWLCESASVPLGRRPCNACPSCRLVQARSHPDLLLLVPDALRELLGLAPGGGEAEEGGEEKAGKKKPSKEIRVEQVRVAIEFATTTSSRGRGKAVVAHPAERMNVVAANALLKTLEEPAGGARFVLCSAAPDRLLPTIRSRCQVLPLPIPPRAEAEAWLAEQGVGEPGVLLAGCGGQPAEVLAWRALGVDAKAWRQLPARVSRGEWLAFSGWPLAAVVDALQKLCHDAVTVACGGLPRFFHGEWLGGPGEIGALFRWSDELRRVAAHAEHPWTLDLSVESLVQQGAEALKTARSPLRRPAPPR